MKNIINWLFGSFFRTIGKVIAFLLLGLILAYIVNSNDLLDKLNLDWLLLNVKASEYYQINYTTFTISSTSHVTKNNLYTDYAEVIDNNNINTLSFRLNNQISLPNNTKLFMYLNIDPDETNSRLNIDFGKTMCISNSLGYECTENTNNSSEFVKPDIEYQVWIYNDQSTKNATPYEIQYINDNLYLLKFQISENWGKLGRIDIQTNVSNKSALTVSNSSYYIGINRYIYLVTNDDDKITQAINNQALQQHQDSQNTQNAINNVNDTLTDDDTTESTNEASNFFGNFSTDTHGLTGIITAPLSSIQSLTSKTCSPLVIPIPFLNNKNLTLPCMRSVYLEFFGDFMDIYDIICIGVVSYWIMVRIFNLVKDFKNPDHDEIEVLDL